MNETLSVIQAIQLILAPAVMINACGLLLLGISNKYSSLFNRIRLLTDEKRVLLKEQAARTLLPLEQRRIANIDQQLQGLLERAHLVRNSVSCYFISVGIFVLTSILIGIEYFCRIPWLQPIIISIFLTGMIVVFLGVLFGVRDTLIGLRVVKLEVELDH
ncbi:MAG: DUF2721 domain-containing protein [Bacteroidetes bacterium]|nr:DUF2721 domain-containing protein [Bacteroidota bacterium]